MRLVGGPHPKTTLALSPTLGFPHCSHLAYFAGKRAGGREGSPRPHVVPHPELLATGNSSRFSEGSKVLWGFLSRFFCLFLESTSGPPSSSSSSRARLLRAPLLGWLPSLGLGRGARRLSRAAHVLPWYRAGRAPSKRALTQAGSRAGRSSGKRRRHLQACPPCPVWTYPPAGPQDGHPKCRSQVRPRPTPPLGTCLAAQPQLSAHGGHPVQALGFGQFLPQLPVHLQPERCPQSPSQGRVSAPCPP